MRKGSHHTEEANRKNAGAHRGRKVWNEGLTAGTDERVARNCASLVALNKNRSPEHSRHISEAKKGKPSPREGTICTAEHKEKVSLAKKGVHIWGGHRVITWGDRISQALKEKCQDSAFALRRVANTRAGSSPTKPELAMLSILDGYFPDQWKFVGNGDFALGNKIPDFLNVDGKKQLIEVYGTYWHRGEDPQERIDFFRQYGFETLVVWENELEDEQAIVSRISNLPSVETLHELPVSG